MALDVLDEPSVSTLVPSAGLSSVELGIGARVDEWTVEAVVARGGYGVVLSARDAAGRRAALKVLHAEHAADPDTAARFVREIAIASRLRHPGVVEILGTGVLPDGRHYLAMELLLGVDLSVRLDRGRLAPTAALRVLAGVASALDAAHRFGVIHRDVQPSNVFLAPRGRVVLLDFGIAQCVEETLDPDPNGEVLGIPAMMAPEQHFGGPVDARADVYALGALLYHMLTGRPAFDVESPTIARQVHRLARRPRPSAIVPVSTAIDQVVTRAMSVRPSDRPASAGAVAAELRAALGRPDGRARARGFGKAENVRESGDDA